MSSPGARQRRRRQQYQSPRNRRELVIAIAAGVGVVAATGVMIWLLRPGGIADRQPRSSWLVGLSLLAAVVATYVLLRPGSRLKVNRRVALPGSLAAIAVIAVTVGVTWNGGIIRHTPKLQPVATTPTTPTTRPSTTTATFAPTTTTAKGSTTTKSSTTTIAKSTTTTAKPGP